MTLWQDFVYGCRMLWNKPGFTTAAVLSLAIGIGANTTIFSLISSSLLRDLGYPESGRLAVIWTSRTQQPGSRSTATAANYREWQRRSQSFEAVGARYATPGNLGADLDGTPAEQISRQLFTASMWDVLQVEPLMGRVFTAEEDQDLNPARVIVLSYRFWQRRFGADPEIIGKTVQLDGEENTIIGVMPEGFDLLSNQTDFFVPAGFSEQQLNSAASFLLVVGRLKPGASLDQAQAEMASVSQGLEREFPDRDKGVTVRLQELREVLYEDVQRPLYVLQGTVAFVLLIACANIAGLLLARAGSRRTEMAVRSSLGAGRGRIVRQLLTESVILSLAGGLLGCALAWVGVRALVAAMPPQIPYLQDAALNPGVLGATAALSVFTGVLFGLVPAMQTSKVDLATALKESGRAGMDAGSQQRFRSALVSVQIGLALMLLIGAGLMMSSFLNIVNNDLGADPSNLLTFEFRFPQNELMEPVSTYRGVGLWRIFPSVALTFDRVYERLQAVPGVESVAAISRRPLSGSASGTQFRIVGRPAPEEGQQGMFGVYFAITPHYFETMRIPLLLGRDFNAGDSASGPLAVIVNETLAKQWFPEGDAVGQMITLDYVPEEQPRQIVGVVGDSLLGPFQSEPIPTIFVPHLQQTEHWPGPQWDYRAMMAFVVRTPGDPMLATNAIRSAVAEIDPSKPASNMSTVEQYLGDQVQGIRLYFTLLAVFGISAAVLAAIGIYGVMAYAVSQRTREIGIRMALGASSNNVMGLMFRQALILIALGLALGLAGAFYLTRFLQGELFEVSRTDPVTFVAVTTGLVLVAVLACLIPARRAAAVHPTEALRYE